MTSNVPGDQLPCCSEWPGTLVSALEKFPGGVDSLGVHEPGKVLAEAAVAQDQEAVVSHLSSRPLSQTRPPSVPQPPASPPSLPVQGKPRPEPTVGRGPQVGLATFPHLDMCVRMCVCECENIEVQGAILPLWL